MGKYFFYFSKGCLITIFNLSGPSPLTLYSPQDNGRNPSPSQYKEFCRVASRYLQSVVPSISDSDRVRPTDRPYSSGYFVELRKAIAVRIAALELDFSSRAASFSSWLASAVPAPDGDMMDIDTEEYVVDYSLPPCSSSG